MLPVSRRGKHFHGTDMPHVVFRVCAQVLPPDENRFLENSDAS
jgi:hypothetical protein